MRASSGGLLALLWGILPSLVPGKGTRGMHGSLGAEQGDQITEADATSFLLRYAPHGAKDVSEEYLSDNVEYALRARKELGYAKELPKELFLSYVLPYANFDEPRDNWRPTFYEALYPHVKDATSLDDAARKLWNPVWNGGLGKQLTFKSNSTPEVMAPISETLKKGYASCTGMSILLCNAYRSVSIPARVVGTNEWNREGGGNHNWVEVWTGQSWNFVDAVPTKEPLVWNKTWFVQGAANAIPGKQLGILSPYWGPKADTGYMLSWREGEARQELPAIDLTWEYSSRHPPLFSIEQGPGLPLGIAFVGCVVAAVSYFGWKKFSGAGYEKLENIE